MQGGGACGASQWAVTKESDGSTAGCHKTKAAAEKQLQALYANEPKGASMRLVKPPTTMEERRGLSLDTAGVSIRAAGDDSGERFHGYAAVFNSRTAIGNPLKWGFYEQVSPGAFSKTLTEGDARFLIDHNPYYVVSRVSADTLTLAQDKRGLAVDSALDERLYYVGALKANVDNRNITGMSFGFIVVKDDWALEEIETSDGNAADVEVRTLLEVRLVEVSAVTFPAYEETQAELNSVARALSCRGDVAAIERRAAFKPELLDLCRIVGDEPAESTRDDEDPAPAAADAEPDPGLDEDSTTTDEGDIPEPAASTRLLAPSVEDRMRALAARYRLPRTPVA